jgi:hypothetical protein
MQLYFVTYGDNKFVKSKQRIIAEARRFGKFTECFAYGPEDLDPKFVAKFANILNQSRGGGYWIWKFQVIKQILEKMNENDILVFADAGCTINIHGQSRFDEYVKLLDESEYYGFLSFPLSHLEHIWTTKEIFDYLQISDCSNITHTGQYIATVIFIKKNYHSRLVIEKIFQLLHDNPLLITDIYNHTQKNTFEDHRHDQSIFSVFRKMYGSIIIPTDETYIVPFGSPESLKYPFWATRIRE